MARECNDQNCSNCKFWKKYFQDGTCQKHTPNIIPIDGGWVTKFPVTDAIDWCGEHEYKSGHWKEVSK